MRKRIRIKALAAAVEAEYAVAEVIDPEVHAIQVEEHMYTEFEVGYLEDNLRENAAVSGMGRSFAGQPAGRWGRITAVVAVKGTGVAYAEAVRPEMDVLLRACCHASEVDDTADAEKVTYTPFSPVDEDAESATVWVWTAGSLYKLVGVRGVMRELVLLPAQHGRAVFELSGVIVDEISDAGIPAELVYPRAAIMPPVVRDANLVMAGFSPHFSALRFEQLSEVVDLPRGNAVTGHAGYDISDWDPHISATIDKPALASFDPYALKHAATPIVWALGPYGASDYNRIQLSGPSGVVVGPAHEDDRGFAMLNVRIRCNNETRDDAYALEFVK